MAGSFVISSLGSAEPDPRSQPNRDEHSAPLYTVLIETNVTDKNRIRRYVPTEGTVALSDVTSCQASADARGWTTRVIAGSVSA